MNTINTTEVGTYRVTHGVITEGEKDVLAENVSYQSGLEIAESFMNLMGGHWREPYTCAGRHFYQIGEHESIVDGVHYVFISSLPFFGDEGTH